MDKKICIKKFLGEESFLVNNPAGMINRGESVSYDPSLIQHTYIPKILKPYNNKRR
jgi:hypothetical protein